LIDEENFFLPISGDKVTKVSGRTVPIDFSINELLKSSRKIVKEDLCLDLIEKAVTIDPMSPALVNPVNISQIDDSRHFIENNFTSDITISDIAGAACMSTFHFNRVFKKMIGYSPYQYLMAFRLEKAKSLLAGAATVSDVAYEVGFNSLENFSYTFRKYTGLSPTEFKTGKAVRNIFKIS
jgi:AraC-like DNA-binding protein